MGVLRPERLGLSTDKETAGKGVVLLIVDDVVWISAWPSDKTRKVSNGFKEIYMKFMMLMIPAVYHGNKKLDGFKPDARAMEAMRRFNEEMGKALKIETLNGLLPLSRGTRVSFGKGRPTVTDGASVDAKEVLGGYWIVDAPSKEEVVKWAQRCPAEEGDTIEVRQIATEEDFK